MKLKGKIIKLEDEKEYFVQEDLVHAGKSYIYAIELTNPKNVNFYLIENGEANPVDDVLAKKLLLQLKELLEN